VRWGRSRLDALREAASLAGFATDRLTMLPEPIAALHAHIPPGSLSPGSRVAVIDTGGGTCDVAIIQTTDDPTPGNDLLVVAQDGDDRLGGNDLDNLLYRWVLDRLTASGRADMVAALGDTEHLGAALTLLDAVRSAKQDLSEHTTAPIGVQVAGQETTLTVTREEYEDLIAEPMSRAGALTARAMSASGTTSLSGLYLTGGTAYTPALARALHQVTGILAAPIGDPKLAVALGALRTPAAVFDPGLGTLAQQPMARRLADEATVPAPPFLAAPPTTPTASLSGPPPGAPTTAQAPLVPPPTQVQPPPPARPAFTGAPPTTAQTAAAYTAAPADPTNPLYAPPGYVTGPAYDPPGPRRPQGVVIAAIVAVALLFVGGGITAAVLVNRSGGNHQASSPPTSDVLGDVGTPSQTPTSTSPEPTGSGTITASTPPGFPELPDYHLFSDEYCSVWNSTTGSGNAPDRFTKEGAEVYRDAYTQMAPLAPPGAEMYFDTLIEFYGLVADALDPASPTKDQSKDKVLEMDDVRRNAELMLLDTTIAACLF
ncbi:MAG: Hsp70 family protein, partial [Micrococcales bacterium]|nr:Hsp70 family protein [Micrococcales bacterium]MCL2668937.1 Hsp70 family protein [Micrococcales bacterium]